MRMLLPLLLLGLPAPAPLAQDGAGQDPTDARGMLEEALGAEGIALDLAAGLASIPARVLVRDDLLEYLLVGPRGATHESLLVTDVTPSLLNTALLALGVEVGSNARWEELEDPERDEEEPPAFRVEPPAGDGFLLYLAWREEGETFLFRVDDLIANLETRRSLRRHRWVYLGSRFAAPREGEPEVFVADYEQNLVCLSFFFQGNTLLTAALPECEAQTIWVANPWLLPPRDQDVRLVFARRAIERLPEAWAEALPRVVAPADRPDAGDSGQSPEDQR